MLLDEVVTEAYSSSDPAEDLCLDSPFQKVVRAWREVPSPSEAAVSGCLQQHEPPTIAQRKTSPKTSPRKGPRTSPECSPKTSQVSAAISERERASFGVREVISADRGTNSPKRNARTSPKFALAVL